MVALVYGADVIIKWQAGIVAGVLLVAAGVAGLWTAALDLYTESARVAGVPVELVLPASNVGSDATPMPAVVVAHGYAGSGRLMRPFADTLARRGYLVALPDLAGHAANTRPFTDIDEAVRDLDAVVRYLRGRPDVDPTRIALLGHSMGASAVVRAGAADQQIAATVAISLGDDEAAALRPGPRNLMLIHGALEPGLAAVTGQALANTDHGEQLAVPFVEHVGVLYADTTHRRAARWIDDGVGYRPDKPTIEAHRRVAGGAATLLGLLLLLTAVVIRRRGTAPTPAGSVPSPWLIGGAIASPVAGSHRWPDRRALAARRGHRLPRRVLRRGRPHADRRRRDRGPHPPQWPHSTVDGVRRRADPRRRWRPSSSPSSSA